MCNPARLQIFASRSAILSLSIGQTVLMKIPFPQLNSYTGPAG